MKKRHGHDARRPGGVRAARSTHRPGALAAVTIAAMIGGTAVAAEGELVMINWLGGAQAEMMAKLQDDFVQKNPDVSFRDIVAQAAGDARGGIRQVILGGEKADLLVNTWPSFREELVDAELLVPLDDIWESEGLDESLSSVWRDLTVVDGRNYGVTYTFGDRSGIWYRPDTFARAGIDGEPQTFDEFKATFEPLREADVTPMAVPAKVWAHAEWFESLLIRTAGVETATRLAAHEIPWTDEAVRTALEKWQELIEAGCCHEPNTMLGLDWDVATDQVLRDGDSGYVLMGMWLNTRAKQEYGEEPGTDFSLMQFPALGMGHDDVSMIDAKELSLLASTRNPEAAAAFMSYMLTADAAAIMADYGLASPSAQADTSVYDPVIEKSVQEVSDARAVQFVLGDLLPGDLGGEYRVQLQKFLQDPSDETIDSVMAALEKVASDAY